MPQSRNDEITAEAERLLKLARDANLGSTVYKEQTEIWVGWQCFTQEQAEGARNFMSDLRILLSGIVSAASEKQATTQGWIPVTERLPEVGIDVLAFNPHNKAIWIEHRERDDEGLDESVTHWMPLPEAPK